MKRGSKEWLAHVIGDVGRKLVKEDEELNHAAFPLILYGQLRREYADIDTHLKRYHDGDPYQSAKLYTAVDVVEALNQRGGTAS